jgi:hypothetical protein
MVALATPTRRRFGTHFLQRVDPTHITLYLIIYQSRHRCKERLCWDRSQENKHQGSAGRVMKIYY